MEVTITIHDVDGTSRDVTIAAAPEGILADVASGLSRQGSVKTWWAGGRPLPPGALIGGPGLRTGDRIEATPQPSEPANSALALEIVGGQWCGRSFPVRPGTTTIGRGSDCDVVLPDLQISREHLRLIVDAGGIRLYDAVSTNGTVVDAVPIPTSGTPLFGGEAIRAGETILTLTTSTYPPAAVRPALDGTRQVNRPPRLLRATTPPLVAYPDSPADRRPLRTSLTAAILPALAGVGLASASGNLEFLAFAALGPASLFMIAIAERRSNHRLIRRVDREYRTQVRSADAEVRQTLTRETVQRRTAHPHPAAVVRTATTPDSRLWERRAIDDDFLDVRVGSADLPSHATVRRDGEWPAGTVSAVPLVVGLASGPLGIAGPRPLSVDLASWVLLQVVTQQPPGQIVVELLLSDSTAEAWRWTRWLPHLGQPPALTPEARNEYVRGLCERVEQRVERRRSSPTRWVDDWIVVVVDRCADLAALPGLARALERGKDVGITAICVDDDRRRLFTSCVTVVESAGTSGHAVRVERSGTSRREDVLADAVEPHTIERAARSLASLVDSSAETTDAIPRSSSLLSALDLDVDASDGLAELWGAGPTTAVPLGSTAHGRFELDLATDGPHALIAGTTGSGKSELLRSLVVGLACRNSPNHLAFVLIDYKGGAAFAECAQLPHTAGLVTDLDSALTERALKSLDAELRRRETLLAAAGQRDFDSYLSATPNDEVRFGRLVLVVDEFAALVDELPDFVDGLVGIAQRGRSLGIHLVLATQRPAGVVSQEIRANTTIRVALRVTDPADSVDVVGTGDAAGIDRCLPGRAFVRIGPTIVQLQTAQAGRQLGGSLTTGVTELDGWARRTIAPDDPRSATELQSLCEQMRALAGHLGVVRPWSPWLPPLPDRLDRDELLRQHPTTTTEIVIGLADLPAQQRQIPFAIELASAEPLLIVGSSGSGRTSALLAIAAAAAERHPPRALHIHAIDCGGGGLRPLAFLAQLGSLVTVDDPELIHRFMSRLTSEIRRRQSRRYDEFTAADPQPPSVLVLLDGWEGYAGATDEIPELTELLARVLREGPGVGISVVVTGDRGALSSRVTTTIRNRLILRLADRADYALAGIRPKLVPVAIGPGRAIRASDGTAIQLVVPPDPSQLSEVPKSVDRRPARGRPVGDRESARVADRIVVRPLPTSIRRGAIGGTDPTDSTSGWREGPLGRETGTASDRVIIGVGGDAATPVRVDLIPGARLLIAGPSRSGRTTALELLAVQLVESGVRVSIAAPAHSRLTRLRDRPGVVLLDPTTTQLDSHSVLIVDDSETLVDSGVGEALTRLARAGERSRFVVSVRSDDPVAAYRGLAGELRRARTGLLLHPSAGGGELFGLRRAPMSRTTTPGRAILVGADVLAVDRADLGEGDVIPVQVAQP